MKSSNLSKLRKKMEKVLEPKRYEHTLSVAYTAANLAAVHGADIEKALVSGILHDCAKCLSHKKQMALCTSNHMHLTELETAKDSPLLHAKAGSILAKEEYGITDEDILNAICYHTTGRPQMSLLEKIIYISDYIEPGRHHMKRSGDGAPMERLNRIRRIAYLNLDEAMCSILSDTLSFLQEKNCKVDSLTYQTYKYYENNLKNNTKANELHDQKG